MGRALAVSKLQAIKDSVSILNKNFKDEGASIRGEVTNMLAKHQPSEIDASVGQKLEKKATEVMSQLPKINQLEKLLEIQEEDAEISMINRQIKKGVQETNQALVQGNNQIREKLGQMPEDAKILTDKQYEDQMSFVLKH